MQVGEEAVVSQSKKSTPDQHAQAVRSLIRLRGRLASRALKITFAILGIGLALLAAAIASHPQAQWLLLTAAVLIFGSGYVLWWLQIVRRHHYYSLPHSRDDDGEHRCISCGYPGIYRQGEYRSNAVYASCAKCGEPLYQE